MFRFNAQNELEVNNGRAYELISGGSTGYIAEHFKWYTGDDYTAYVGMLYSHQLTVPFMVALLGVRAALMDAAANHHGELGDIAPAAAVAAGAAGAPVPHTLALNAVECIDDAALVRLTNFASLNVADWGTTNPVAAVPAAGGAPAVAAVQGVCATRVPAGVRAEFMDPDMSRFADECARMCYSILACNAYGLISGAHHYTGQAVKAAEATIRMYALDRKIRDRGINLREFTSFLFHDVLHPVNYEFVANWGNALPVTAVAKVASTVHKRLPAYPGGSAFIKNGVTIERIIRGAANIAELVVLLFNTPAHARLNAVSANILANPLNFNGIFRPVAYAGNKPEVDSCIVYVSAICGVYDRWMGIVNVDMDEGPTKGPGIKKLIAENRASYLAGVDMANQVINAAIVLAPNILVAQIGI